MEQELRKTAVERYLKGESPKSIYTDLKRSKTGFSSGSNALKADNLNGTKIIQRRR